MQQIQRDIQQKSFHPVYLLFGEELYLKNQFTDRLRQALCTQEDTMNTHFFQGKEVPIGEVIDLAETLPFFAERRVIFLKDTGLFKSGGEKMAEYLTSPNESTVFVFTESEVDKRSKLFKTVSSKGHVAEFSIQDDATLKRWVVGLLGQEQMKVTNETVELFLGKTGSDMQNIRSELEKLVCYCMGKTVVTSNDVESICTNRVSNHIFDMINAIADNNTSEALRLYYDLLALKEPPMRILFLLSRQCNLLLQVKELKMRGHDNRTIASNVGLPPYIVGKYLTQAARFKSKQLKDALKRCVESEEAVKTGRMNDTLSIEVLIFSVFR